MIFTFSALILCFLAASRHSLVNGSPTSSSTVDARDQLKSEYDYIIVGGGTAGLTVADRLTESGKCMLRILHPLHKVMRMLISAPKDTVLVIEYGFFGNYHCLTTSSHY
jgi:hypothetical protein